MTIHLLTIPDDPQAWPQWLTARFHSGQLPLLVQELHLLGGRTADAPNSTTDDAPDADLADVLSPDRQQQVALNGLEILTTDELQHLFARPDTLLQLHACLCLCGGPRWAPLWSATTDASNALPRSSSQSAADRIWQQAIELNLVPAPNTANPSAAAPRTTQPATLRTTSWPARMALVATAAALLLAIFVWRQNQPRFSGRVLGTPGLLAASDDSPAAWFKRVATAGTTWFNLQPRTADELKVLLSEVSQDCQLLIDAPPPMLLDAPLTPNAPGDPTNQSEWFVQKCSKWKGAFDKTLEELKSGQIDFETARAQADNTMMRLISVLNQGPTAPNAPNAKTNPA